MQLIKHVANIYIKEYLKFTLTETKEAQRGRIKTKNNPTSPIKELNSTKTTLIALNIETKVNAFTFS